MRAIASILVSVLLCGFVHAADAPATKPSTQPADEQRVPVLVKASDKAGLVAAMGKDVILEGVVDKAAWSSTGKVMQATFKDAGDPKLQLAIFSAKRVQFDEAFNGDIAKTLRGAKVRVHGTLKDFKGSPEILLDNVSNLTIMEE